ncbi:MAG: hypothetical protein OEY06_01610 [Gammaproteobacteria bacterium]|nr:hypothetical protein [Gammaproteobacteria bacterium]
MKTTILIFMAVITASLAHSVMAENNGDSMPPPGPYRSIGDVDQHTQNQNGQNDSKMRKGEEYSYAPSGQMGGDIPDWQRQRQAQNNNRMQQLNRHQSQGWNSPPPQWNYNYVPPVRNTYSGQAPAYQNNGMRQSFPSARGPVYGPGAPPAGFYNQSMQPVPRY